jgi:hypothetical protein
MVADNMSIPTRRTGNQDRAMVIGMFCDSMRASSGAGCACERYVIGGLLAAVGNRRLGSFWLLHKARFLWFFGSVFGKGVEGFEGSGEWLEML